MKYLAWFCVVGGAVKISTIILEMILPDYRIKRDFVREICEVILTIALAGRVLGVW